MTVPRTRFQSLTAIVVDHFGVTEDRLLGPERQRSVSRPRQTLMWLTRQNTTLSLPQIGQRVGGRDHTTVLHGVRTIDKLRRENPLFDAELAALEMRAAANLATLPGRPSAEPRQFELQFHFPS